MKTDRGSFAARSACALLLLLGAGCGEREATDAPVARDAGRPPAVAGLASAADAASRPAPLDAVDGAQPEPERVDESPELAEEATDTPPAPDTSWIARAPRFRLDRDGRTVHGQVFGPTGKPAYEAIVTVLSPDGERVPGAPSVMTNPEGRFLLASPRYDQDWEGWLLSVRARGQPRLLAVLSRREIERQVSLPATATLRGELRFDDGSPVTDAELRLAGDGGRFGPLPAVGDSFPADARTDGNGRFEVPLPEDVDDARLVVLHDEYAAELTPDLEAWRADPAGYREMVLAQRLAYLEVVVDGPLSAHETLGRDLFVVAMPLVRAADGTLSTDPESALRVPAAKKRAFFPRLSGDWLIQLDDGRDRGPLVEEPFAASPGRHRMTLPLERPGPWEPGVRWFVPVQLVDRTDGEPWSPGGMPWPDVVVTDARGAAFTGTLDPASGQALVHGVMQPPVNVDLHVAGIELRRGDVDPGEVVSLRVDTEKFLEAFGNLIVDFTGIGDDGTPTLVQIDLTPLGDLASIAPSRWIDRSVVRGVPPGRWRYEICGPLLASTSGEVEIVPGGHTMIRAEPRTP